MHDRLGDNLIFFVSFHSTNAGGNLRPSKFYGAKKGPSQSPSMRLLGKIHIIDDDDKTSSKTSILLKYYAHGWYSCLTFQMR